MKFVCSALLCFFLSPLFAQEKSKAKFGKVSATDFSNKVYPIDSNAAAVIIADIGYTEVIGNRKANFSLEFTRYKRVHILNKNGYDIANVEIDLYTKENNTEEVQTLKATTYNLENGQVVETKLDTKTAVFKDRINKHRFRQKFTFPNIKEGSIIEFEYKIQSDFMFNLQPWNFQDQYPCLWSEYNVSIPEFYYYVRLTQGYQAFSIQDKKDRVVNFKLSDNTNALRSERTDFTADVADYRWVMKDVPALKEESYTSTINNHLARIEFQLAELKHPFVPKDVMGTWESTCETLLASEDFGYSINRNNGWVNDVLKDAVGTAANDLEKAKNIFAYVRDHITCTGRNRTTIDKPLSAVLKSGNGSEAEINLLLTAMLSKAELSADPVLLSTRSHGYVYPQYPLFDRFNYVVTQLTIYGKHYYLDASAPWLGFGKLGYDAYNGHARVVNQQATPLELVADSLLEKKFTSVFISNDEKGGITGAYKQDAGYYQSYNLRNKIKEKGREQILTEIKKDLSADFQISGFVIDSLTEYDRPVILRYNFHLPESSQRIIYFNPMLAEAVKENPFKSSVRTYPVEMPWTVDETYALKFEVPIGYVVDELPQQMVLKLNEEGDGSFEYRLSESKGVISLLSRLRIRRTFFLPEEYDMIREFYNMIVKKHSEQIVLKKQS